MTDRASGYILTEVLVAGAIAAAVLTAGMGGLALSVRAAARADAAEQAALEANNIAARLRAGLPVDAIADAYPDWRIEVRPFDRPVDPASGAVLTQARLEHGRIAGATLDLVYLEPGAGGTGPEQ